MTVEVPSWSGLNRPASNPTSPTVRGTMSGVPQRERTVFWRRGGSVSAGSYTQNRVDNSATRYLNKAGALTGVVDGPAFTFSAWVRPDTVDFDRYMFVLQGTGVFIIFLNTAAKVAVFLENDDFTTFSATSAASVSLGSLNYVKVVCNFSTDSLAITINGATESFTLSLLGDATTCAFNDHGSAVVYAGNAGTLTFDGAMGDIFFDDSILLDASLAYNGGTPLDPTAVSAAVKITGQDAASFAAGTANTNGSGGAFVQAGTGSWVNA